LYYAPRGAHPASVQPGGLTGEPAGVRVPRFVGDAEEQIRSAKEVSRGELLLAMKTDLANGPAAAAATLKVFDALVKGGGPMRFFKTHYEDDTQVYDGYVAAHTPSGEIRQLAM